MKTPTLSRNSRTFFFSTWRLAILAPLVFSTAVLAGYTATAKAPTVIKKIEQMSGPTVELTIPNALDPIVFTDRANYFPGETAFISGLGFWPNETVTLQVVHTDGTSNDGGGHLPWNVSADALGSFDSVWFVDPDDSAGSAFLLTATGNSSGLVAQATFTDGSANLDTCENGPAGSPTPCTGDAWTNGNVNAQKAHYAEGESVPYRTILENLIVGNTYTLTIEYDTTQGGDHAFDYLTSFDRTEPTPGNNPCTRKQGGSIVSICNPLVSVTTPIPIDQNVTNGPNGVPGGGDDITQIAGVFTLFNGNALSIVNPLSPYTLDGTYAGNSSTSITVQFNATSTIAVLAWGGHISTRLDWGIDNSAIDIEGSPYHMRLTDITCSGAGETCNVGNQDHQLAANAVFFPIQLTIIKETNPDNAQSKTFNYTTTGTNLSPFSLTPANGTTPAQTQFNLLDTTTRTVTESDPSAAAPQFNLTALSCTQTDGGLGIGTFDANLGTRTVEFTPKEGQFISCTFVNEQVLGKIIVDKVTVPGGDPTSFDFTTTYGSPFSLTDGATPNDSGFIVPGSYQVTETPNPDYDTTATCTSSLGHPADNPNSITLDAGETVTCTFTNTKKPKLTVTKIVINDNGGTKQISDFPLFVDGNPVTSGAKNTSTIGSHTVSETSDPGYTATIGGDCAADGSVTLVAGDDKTCTITNDDKAAKLIVIKHVINDNGGTATAANFTLDSGGSNDSPDNFPGAEAPGTEVTLDAGSYNVTESGPSGYTASFSTDCSGTIANGEEKTCTVTNDDQAAKLIVIKHVMNDNGGTATAANFTLDSGGSNDSPDNFPGAEAPGTQVTLDAGSYNVTESGPSGYAASFSADCSGTIANGQEKTCTVTNDDISPTLRVIKDLVPDTDSGLFNLRIDGATAGTGANVGDGGTTGFVPVNAGNHVVSETAGTDTSLADYVTVIGGDCAANGTVSLALAQNKTCTITNTKKGKAEVVKTVSGQPPAGGQSFTFELRQGASTVADGTVLETKNTDASGNISFTTQLIPGDTYQICEWVFPGWNTNLVGDGPLFVPNSLIPPSLPNPNVNNLTVCANFTVQPGQTRTFTVNNTPPPGGRALTIGFWKNWASCSNSNGKGQKPILDLALGIASATTTNPPGGLVASAQNPGTLWPNYAATWYLVLKGNPASNANNILAAPDCTSTVNLLNKSTADGKKKMASDPLFNMTAQLIGAQLNRFMGAGINGTTIMNIDRAVLLNGKYKFNGLNYNPKLTTADANTANCLATQLDNYNNGNPVALCP